VDIIKHLPIFIFFVYVSDVFPDDGKYPQSFHSRDYAKIKMKQEPFSTGSIIVSTGHSLPATYNLRESGFFATLIDSSLNGYGAYNNDPNPLAFVPGEGYFAVYRQFQGFNASSGYIGAAHSQNGIDWVTVGILNECYPSEDDYGYQLCEPYLPTQTGMPQGRYPNAGFTADSKPTVIWNERTNNDFGGGNKGGYPLYTYSYGDFGESASWNTPINLNNGCMDTPCNPADLWVGNARIINGQSGPKLVALYDSWADDTKEFMITSSFYVNGHFQLNEPYILFDQMEDDPENPGDGLWFLGEYQTRPDWSINDDGVGYMAIMGWWNGGLFGTESPTGQTLYIKKTVDYGENWTNNGGFHNTGWYEWSDELQYRLMDSLLTAWSDSSHPLVEEIYHYGDTISSEYILADNGDSVIASYLPAPAWQPFYTFDILTDEDGGVHVVWPYLLNGCQDYNNGCEDLDGDNFPDSLYVFPYLPGNGFMHMYNPNPINESSNWIASLLSDMSVTYNADFYNSPIPHAYSNEENDYLGSMQYFYPQLSSGPNNTIWFASSQVSELDPLTNYPTDIDIFVRKSTDNGITWSDEENVTDTPMGVISGNDATYYLETGMHLAQKSTENEISIFFQMPDLENLTNPPGDGYEDYFHHVYVGIYTNDFSSSGNASTIDHSYIPETFILEQNHPNPFNPVTTLRYNLPEDAMVNITIYDMKGREVSTLVSNQQNAGFKSVQWNATNNKGAPVSAGLYMYTMEVGQFRQTKKMVLLK